MKPVSNTTSPWIEHRMFAPLADKLSFLSPAGSRAWTFRLLLSAARTGYGCTSRLTAITDAKGSMLSFKVGCSLMRRWRSVLPNSEASASCSTRQKRWDELRNLSYPSYKQFGWEIILATTGNLLARSDFSDCVSRLFFFLLSLNKCILELIPL